ncbi:MAG: M55 family metallopeptidase [Chloroflexota bacterium]
MKVYIAVDIDGVSGVVALKEAEVAGRDYERCRHWMALDANAAVEGAFAGGATEVVVHDMHAWVASIPWDEIHPRAQLIKGGQEGARHFMQGLDGSFDALFLVGMHVRSGGGIGVLSHTLLGDDLITDVRVNEDYIGEGGLSAAFAGQFGVPLALTTGDDLTMDELRHWQPELEGAVVKYAIDRFTARCLPQQEALTIIRDAAERAVRRVPLLKPFSYAPPVKLEVACGTPVVAQRLAYVPGAQWDGHRTVSYLGKDFAEVYRALLTFVFVAISIRFKR